MAAGLTLRERPAEQAGSTHGPAEGGEMRLLLNPGARPAFPLALLAIGVAGLCISCVPDPGQAPDEAKELPAVTPDTLAKLFERECLEQADREWVRAKARSIRAQCGPFDNGDCTQNVDGEVRWWIPAQGRPAVRIAMNWSWSVGLSNTQELGPPAGKLDCFFSTKEAYGDQLQQAAARLAAAHRWRGPYPQDVVPKQDFDRRVIWYPTAAKRELPRIELKHFVSTAQYRADEKALNGGSDPTGEAIHARQALYPWILEFVGHYWE